jgi:hypothetical protein
MEPGLHAETTDELSERPRRLRDLIRQSRGTDGEDEGSLTPG